MIQKSTSIIVASLGLFMDVAGADTWFYRSHSPSCLPDMKQQKKLFPGGASLSDPAEKHFILFSRFNIPFVQRLFRASCYFCRKL